MEWHNCPHYRVIEENVMSVFVAGIKTLMLHSLKLMLKLLVIQRWTDRLSGAVQVAYGSR